MKSFIPTVQALAVAAVLAAVAALATEEHEGHNMGAMDSKPAQAAQSVTKTVTGEVIDITCHVRMAAQGADHVKCALYCADLGMPLGILEKGSNTIYLIIPKGHAAPKEAVGDFLGQQVTAKVSVREKGGLKTAEVLEIAAARG